MPKQFWEKWEYRAWLADSNLTSCHEATRGIWVDWLNHMMEDETYFLTGTLDDLARMGRTTKPRALAAVLDLYEHDAARIELVSNGNVTQKITHLSRTYNGKITVTNRRRERRFKAKELNRLRQERYRQNHPRNAENDGQSKSKKTRVTKEVTPEEVASATKRPRGTRLPDQFFLTSEMRSWAAEKRPHVDLIEETEKFCNHFRSAPGQKGVKLDWLLTWKNWILNAKSNGNGTSKQSNANGRRTTVDRLRDQSGILDKYDSELIG